jgi:hypothetical protein
MVTIEEFDKKGKKVTKEVVYEEDSNSSNDSDDMGLDFMERMLGEESDEDDEYYDEGDEYYNEEDDEVEVEEEDSEPEEEDYSEEESEDADDDNGKEQDSDGEDSEENNDERIHPIRGNSHNIYIGDGGEQWTLDLRNLLAVNTHQIDLADMYKVTEASHKNEKVTIDVEQKKGLVNDDYLLQKASEGCTQLLAGLWKLDTQKSDAGPMAILPSYFEIPTPRSLVSIPSHTTKTFGMDFKRSSYAYY